ncbi:hypothetical protein pb186bvf_014104 [Paramecium bursaria]
MALKRFAGIKEIIPKQFDPFSIPRKEALTENEKKHQLGITNFNKILPTKVVERNGKYGFFRSALLDNRTDHNPGWYQYEGLEKKIARVYLQTDNQMHQTPTIRLNKWVVQFDRSTIVRIPFTGWTYTDDCITRFDQHFESLEDAIEFCQEIGVGYHVQYPRFRYTQKKSYADNFKWKGFPKDDPDQ